MLGWFIDVRARLPRPERGTSGIASTDTDSSGRVDAERGVHTAEACRVPVSVSRRLASEAAGQAPGGGSSESACALRCLVAAFRASSRIVLAATLQVPSAAPLLYQVDDFAVAHPSVWHWSWF